jgi:hypothetical protein
MNMKPIVLTATLLLVSGSILGEPVLKIEPEVFQFGMIPREATVAHYFWFESAGTDTVFIDSIKTGCACATMPIEQEHLAPGEKMRVGLFWDVGKRIGSVLSHPYIFYNGKELPTFAGLRGQCLLHMDSLRPVTVRPHRVDFVRLPATSKSIDEIELAFLNLSDERLDLTVVANSAEELIELRLPKSLKAGASVTGRVIVRPEHADEPFERSFTLEFSDENRTRLTVPVRRKVY